MMRVLVTGGAGFIGSHLVDVLVKLGHAVRVLDSLEQQVHGGRKPAYLNSHAEYLFGDVRDRSVLKRSLKDTEIVFHEAASVGVGQSMYEIERYTSANVLGTATLLDMIVNERLPIKKIIVASSMSIYGEGAYRCTKCGPVFPSLRPEEQLKMCRWEMTCPQCRAEVAAEGTTEAKLLAANSVYAISKRDQEELCLCVGRGYRIPAVALRYFNVYGPRQALSNPYTGVCAIFSARIKNGNPPVIFEDGRQSRDFIHVEDIVRANILAMENPSADGQMFNVGTGKAISILDIAETLIRLYGASVTPEVREKYRAGDIRHCFSDIRKITQLGFKPQINLAEGLQDLVSWGKDEAAEDRVEEAAKELERRGLT